MMEAAAPKPGNVHPDACFEDVTYADFVASANAIEPIFRNLSPTTEVAPWRVGEVILESVLATRAAVGSNTNLGMILLLAPLAAVPRDVLCQEGIGAVLTALTKDDCRDVYAAIRAAQPGGLGKTANADVRGEVPDDLSEAMRSAANRDLVARQYINDYADVLSFVTPTLRRFHTDESETMESAIVLTQLETMSKYPDSLIQRKCGHELAAEASSRARRVMEARERSKEKFATSLSEFDIWLRADGHRRNPGTTADLLAAAIFVFLRDRTAVG